MSLDDTNFSDADSDQSNPPQTEGRSGGQVPSWGAKRCPSCYSVVLHSQTVCAECGTRLVPRVTRIRCLRCGKHATSDHVICPSCGRNLHAAPSRMLTFGVPALLVGVLAIVLIARGMPAFLQESDNLPLLQNFVITPASSESEPNVLPARESLAPAVVQSGPGQSDESASSNTETTVVADSTPTPTPEESGTAIDGSEAGSMPADTSVPPVVTPPVTATAVEEEPTATAAAVENTATASSPFPPLPTVTETATSTAMPTPAWLTYTIRAGDTIGSIANRFGIPQEELLRANDLTPRDVTRLQIGDVIVLPGLLQATPTPTPTADVSETPSATPAG
ncbi:MAG: LysM peptidoglycan-binding domain-containing protein [Caldilineaceae bacterium SB0675_bin_29]|uniref:LysM peptidoglycan-binding domain-containing protein n=1 Tax=Caldilineaceae bacterium SB0675_bin_29 TaxID=2605266 RepID=A0A6B1FZ70_9CHLR|nr:LysM peptidoglycan-binding domain-containing protein [Caldilineaceae bacterium SB0675_bin_29]